MEAGRCGWIFCADHSPRIEAVASHPTGILALLHQVHPCLFHLQIPKSVGIRSLVSIVVAEVDRSWISPGRDETRQPWDIFLFWETSWPDPRSQADHARRFEWGVVYMVDGHVETTFWSFGRVVLRVICEFVNCKNHFIFDCKLLRNFSNTPGSTNHLQNHYYSIANALYLEISRLCKDNLRIPSAI